MAIKALYTFTVDKETEVEKTEEVDGGKLVKKVKELRPVKFVLRRPNRAIIDANELFYGIQYNEAVKLGLMPRALFAKRLDNDNGVFNNAQLKELESLENKFNELGAELTKHFSTKEEDRTPEENKKAGDTFNDYLAIQRRLNEYKNAEQSMFDNTAENRARIKAILWYSLFLSYVENDKGDLESVYAGDTFEAKLKSYDKIDEEGDDFSLKVAKKFGYFVSALYLGQASTEEEFKALDERLDSSLMSDEPVKEDEEPIEETVDKSEETTVA